MPEKVEKTDWQGYLSGRLDIAYILDAINACENNRLKPFYQSEPHRKIFYDKDRKVYIKIVDEAAPGRGFIARLVQRARTADLYFRYYKILEELKVGTPILLACLRIKNQTGEKSIIVTEEVAESKPLNTFLPALKNQAIRDLIVSELARVSAVIHRAGYYFSLDLRNILARATDTDAQLFVLDLEHMKYAGLWARRRIKRNLMRFKSGFLSLPNAVPAEWDAFSRRYEELRSGV